MNDDITDRMMTFRECCRQVWNSYFRTLDEGWHAFINVELALFDALVVDQVDEGEALASMLLGAANDTIAVIPTTKLAKKDDFWRAEGQEGVRLPTEDVDSSSLELRFVSFSDWSEDGYRDFAHVRALVRTSENHPLLVGAELLLPSLTTRFHVAKS